MRRPPPAPRRLGGGHGRAWCLAAAARAEQVLEDSARIALKRGSWFRALRSRGRGMSTVTAGQRGPRASAEGHDAIREQDPSSTSFVMSSTVLRSCPPDALDLRLQVARVSASRAESGSSMSSTAGSMARARARDTRCRMPPDNSRGRFPGQRSGLRDLCDGPCAPASGPTSSREDLIDGQQHVLVHGHPGRSE